MSEWIHPCENTNQKWHHYEHVNAKSEKHGNEILPKIKKDLTPSLSHDGNQKPKNPNRSEFHDEVRQDNHHVIERDEDIFQGRHLLLLQASHRQREAETKKDEPEHLAIIRGCREDIRGHHTYKEAAQLRIGTTLLLTGSFRSIYFFQFGIAGPVSYTHLTLPTN